MTPVSTSILVEAPAAAVWVELSDLASHVEWMTDAETIDFETVTTSGEGVRMRVHTRIGPLRTVDVIEVTEWDPVRRIGVSHRGLISGYGSFDLAALAGGTRITWSEDLIFPMWLGGRVTAWFARPILAAVWRRNLAALKRRIEAV
ncbi:MAG: SRPBCC family protein [Acidimicrobiia bacterium]